MWLKTFKRKSYQETVEVETEIGPTVEVETTQGITTGIEVGVDETTEINIEIEVEKEEIVETIQEIEIETEIKAEVEIGLIPDKEEEINQDLDQVKDTLTGMTSATTATEQVMKHKGASN